MDEQYMRQALDIARYAIGRTSPNPMVGAVIVSNGRVVGQGWHRKAGTPHAEVHALQQAGELARGATMYVTLEPCSHHGRTGPCADAVAAAGIKKVVIGMNDPNPLVAGKGIAKLRAAGIEVVEGVLAAEAAKLNEIFIKWISTQMPFIAVKSAMSLDGKIAAHTGHSQWITGEKSRERVQQFRDCHDGILVGIGTVLADNPSLTARLSYEGKNPIRIIIDSMARTPLDAKVVTDGLAPTIIVVTPSAPSERVNALRARGAEILSIESKEGRVDLREAFKALAKRDITSILIEGGASINGSIMEEHLADKIYWFIAPKIIGGQSALGPVGGQGVTDVNHAHRFEDLTMEPIGQDILISAYMCNREGRDVYRTCGRIR